VTSKTVPISIYAHPNLLVLRSSRLLCLCSTDLCLWGILLGTLRETDGRCAGNSWGTEIRSVSRLRGARDNSLVGPGRSISILLMSNNVPSTDFLVVLFPPKVVLWAAAPGFWVCFCFLVTKVTPPLSPSAAWIPTAYPDQYFDRVDSLPFSIFIPSR